MTAKRSVLAVHRNTREVAYVLVRTRKLVEECGLAAVLISHQRKRQDRALGQRVTASLGMELALLSQAGMRRLAYVGARRCLRLPCLLRWYLVTYVRYVYARGIVQAKGELVPMYAQLHGVPHRRILHQRHARPWNHSHVEEVLPQRTFSADSFYHGALAYFQLSQRHSSPRPSICS